MSLFPDPDAALTNAFERIEELEKREGIPVAWANAHTLLEARIEAIERLFSGDRGVNAWIATTKHHGDQIDMLLGDIERNRKLVARVEELESRCPKCGKAHKVCDCLVAIANAIGLRERIEALEGEHLSIAHRTSAMERDRSLHADRWHATYNAALIAHASAAHEKCHGVADDIMHECLRLYAKADADLAHGPLERTPAAPGWAAWNANVEALVKLTREACTRWHGAASNPGGDAYLRREQMTGEYEQFDRLMEETLPALLAKLEQEPKP